MEKWSDPSKGSVSRGQAPHNRVAPQSASDRALPLHDLQKQLVKALAVADELRLAIVGIELQNALCSLEKAIDEDEIVQHFYRRGYPSPTA